MNMKLGFILDIMTKIARCHHNCKISNTCVKTLISPLFCASGSVLGVKRSKNIQLSLF